MGHVAISAGYYLLAKLEMQLVAEFSPRELFDGENVEVKAGVIQMGRLPRSRIFTWKDTSGKHDILAFVGEAQPPIGKYAFCQNLISYAQKLGVERVFTFAAMATQMHPDHDSRVFAAATDQEGVSELKQLEVDILQDGNIGGMNGTLLAVAAENSLSGACLLGEMPHIVAQFPFPKAALAVLRVFAKIAAITLDFTELCEQATAVEQKLGELLAQVEEQMQRQRKGVEEQLSPEVVVEERISKEDSQRIEQLFEQARQERSKAYELKRELDRLDVFKEYEDRFLDLFKPPA
jgi:proteasome assembly chaperone (PAC2) family protein